MLSISFDIYTVSAYYSTLEKREKCDLVRKLLAVVALHRKGVEKNERTLNYFIKINYKNNCSAESFPCIYTTNL